LKTRLRDAQDGGGGTLRDEGIDTKAMPVRKIRSVTGYDALLVQGPFYCYAWSKSARSYVGKHRHALESMQVVLSCNGQTWRSSGSWPGNRP